MESYILFGRGDGVEIRTMVVSDYDAVYALWERTGGMGLRSLDDSREGIERFLRRNPKTCFAAIEDGRTVGVLLCGHDGRRGYIYHAAVDIACRGRGIGRALLEKALGALEEEGINKAALVVFETNAAGNAFWEKVGFEKRTDLIYRNKSINSDNR